MKIRAVLFDLDDTLYPELDYVHSGFRAVARFLANFSDERDWFAEMLQILEEEGRGRIFDRVLEQIRPTESLNVHTLLFVYRSHIPEIELPENSLRILRGVRESGCKTGLVTDGCHVVQRNKTQALGMEELMDVIVHTDVLGSGCWKPSPVPFEVAMRMLDLDPGQGVYVGDNPAKDFSGARSLGMKTIRIGDGCAAGNLPWTDADHCADSLEEITEILDNLSS